MLTGGCLWEGQGRTWPHLCLLLSAFALFLHVSHYLLLSVCLSPPHSSPELAWSGALVSALVTGDPHGPPSPAFCCPISLPHLLLDEELRVPRGGEPQLTAESRRAGEGWGVMRSSLAAVPGRSCLPGPWAILMKLYLGRLEVLSSWAQVSLAFLYVQCTLPTTKLPLSKALCSGRGGGHRFWDHTPEVSILAPQLLSWGRGLGQSNLPV